MKLNLFLCVLLFSIYSGAQTSAASHDPLKIGTVTGKVIDATLKQPVPYATVVIKNKEDGSTVVGAITGEDGSFRLVDIGEGAFMFEVQFIGYENYTKAIEISRQSRNIDLGVIELKENVTELEGVDVVAERSTIEQKIDRKVINVGKDLTTQGATAADIMNNIPSVNVDQQSGALSLRGNSNVRVMVDGKLSNVPVAQLLKQIPSTSIKSIELITNPSAKYNPEGMSGIINIVLHKNANIGFNGNVNIGLGYEVEAKFNSSADLNYRNGKFNFYGSYGNNIGKQVNDGQIERLDLASSPDYNEYQVQKFGFNNNNKSHLYKLGFDFYLNDKNTISLFTNQNSFNGKGTGNTDVDAAEPSGIHGTQSFLMDDENLNEQYNFNYKLDFDKEGHNLELEADWSLFHSNQDARFNYSGFENISSYNDYVNTARDQVIVNLDYVNPIGEKSKLELGLESRNFETNVGYRSTGFTFNSSGDLVPTPDTEFVYGMDIYSAYATFGQNYEKWSYQVGARFETVSVAADTNQVRSFTDDYNQIYPSAFINYTPSEKNQYQISYSKRVDRPGLGQVNPIREWSTPLLSSFGNEELKPQFTNSFETNYTHRFEKLGSLTLGAFYRNIKDEINRAVYVDRLDITKQILTFRNFDDTEAYGVELSANIKPTEWWSINASTEFFAQTQRGLTERLDPEVSDPGVDDIITQEIEVNNGIFNFRMNNNFTVTKKLTLSVFGFYRGQSEDLQVQSFSMYFINTGARYAFADGNGTISLNFNDIFNTAQWAFKTDRPYPQRGQFNWESRTVYLGLQYRFSSGKVKSRQRKQRDDNTKSSEGIL
ncbi:outer membrane beta-barrel family protein [Robertkochia solimangrovi]|uniref:outer membrane beta-barrel family protein n=1 Tax=Robertkochia solimangrovi TaxID=2213046 RepID=UPI00117C83AF|nr:outer membrane beta-barrel family protein [Robertkochia solimangrovi]TRZ41798.1 TonB-dependent receptor [Robertkochia solimangrovi]